MTRVQRLTINLLKRFILICEENNLTYYFTGGALIGVLRHGGFIPWDDDIDVGMPRKDYEKFISLMHRSRGKDGFDICDRHTDKDWHFCMCQFIDLDSEIEIDLAREKRKAHVWIDVFPLDGLPSNTLVRWARVKRIMLKRYIIQMANIKKQVDSHRDRPAIEKIVLRCAEVFKVEKIIKTDKQLNALERLLKKYDFDSAKYVGNMLGRYREREVVPREYFGIPKKATFEGISVNIPEKSHELQTALYGDYLKLPPKSQRVGHSVTIVSERKI